MTIAKSLRSAPTAAEKLLGHGRLLELWLEVGSACHLNCDFCFNGNGDGQADFGLLSIEEYLDILRQFRDMGGVAVGIPGNGEPFHARNLPTTMAIVREAAQLGLRANVFTAGDLLDEELVSELCSLGVSLSLKWNSFRPAVQDKLVGSVGYTARRARTLGLLYRHGFNQPDADGVSCLAFVNSIMPGVNDREIPRLYRYCREHGIVPDIDTLLPFGRAQLMTEEETRVADRVAGELRWFDLELGIEWIGDSSTTYLGSVCDRCFHHLYIDCLGRVSPCLGANKREVYLGNVKLDQLDVLWRRPLMCNIRARRYTGRCADCAKFLDGRCNSCLGRFASQIELGGIITIGCWRFEKA